MGHVALEVPLRALPLGRRAGATVLTTRGFVFSAMRLIVPPLPAVSRPSKMTITRMPLWMTHSCMRTNSVCSRASSFS